MSNIEREILRYPLRILKWCGQNPKQGKMIYFFVVALFGLLGLIEIVLIILQFFYANGDINIIAPNIEAAMAFIQITGKFMISAVKMEDFRTMIDDTKKFWSTKMCKKDVRIKLETTLRQTLQLEKLYLYTMIFTGTIVLPSPALTKQLPTGAWVMQDYNSLFVLALVIQEVIIVWQAIYTVAYDGLFLSFCVLLRAQFKMLHNSLKDLDVSTTLNKSGEKVYLDKLISYIQHHEFLLRFSKNMRSVYSPIMLVIYSTLLLMYCAEMYILFEGKNVLGLVRSSFVMASCLILFAFYCIPLNYVTDEAISVSQGIYDSNWYSKYIPTSRSLIPVVIQRSQQDIIFTAGELVEINCRTMLSVMKMSYSVCAIMRAVKNDESDLN